MHLHKSRCSLVSDLHLKPICDSISIMKLEITAVKEELANLREKKANLERKIQGLESYLGVDSKLSNGNGTVQNKVSARGGIDIRPTVETTYKENNNHEIKLKDLVDIVAQKHPDTERAVIERKMIHIKRTILEQVGYGKYHLKTETPHSDEQGVV